MSKTTIKYEDLPDTIGIREYMQWRGCGRATADATFHAKCFTRLRNTGTKLLADKRAVLLYEMGLSEENTNFVLKEIAREMIGVKINEKETENSK